MDDQMRSLRSSGGQPSSDQIESAMKSCGLTLPEQGSNQSGSPEATIGRIERAYKDANTDDERNKLRQEMKSIFYSSDSETVKSQIRIFFKENRESTAFPPSGERVAVGVDR